MNRLKTYASFVRLSHSVFALPFALTGALLALHRTGDWSTASIGWRLLWIVVAMVTARSAAMGFNRLVDARFDALNPRTASRELPRGAMTLVEATIFVVGFGSPVRVRGLEAWPAVLRAVAGRAGHRVLVFPREARDELHAALPRPGDGRCAGRRVAGRRRTRRVGALAARARRSVRGSAASMSCTRARTSSSIARTACGRFPSDSGCGARWLSPAPCTR